MRGKITLTLLTAGILAASSPLIVEAWPYHTHKKMVVQAVELLPLPYRQIMRQYTNAMQQGTLQIEYVYFFYGAEARREALQEYGTLTSRTTKALQDHYAKIQEIRKRKEPIHKICFELGQLLMLVQNLTRPPFFSRGGYSDAYTRDFHEGIERYAFMKDYIFDPKKVATVSNMNSYLERLVVEAKTIDEEYRAVYESNKVDYKGTEEITDKAYARAVYSCTAILLYFFQDV